MPTDKTKDKVLKKRKLPDAVPERFKKKLDKPRLRDLTFNDLLYIHKIMGNYFDDDDTGFLKTACSVCSKWRG
jgi:hypothetical protein